MVKKATFFFVILICAFGSLTALENYEIREILDSTTVRVDLLDDYSEIYSFGSGFFISESGMILTNFHVIEDSIRYDMQIRVNLQNGSTYEAEIIHWNARRDWAVLQIYSSNQYPYLEFAEGAEILDDIWAAGFPITGNFKITAGMINSYQPDFMDEGLDYYDVSMKFDGGNSGGPVINNDGDVVGIVVAYYTEARAFDFIIPIEEVAEEIYWLRYISGSQAYVPSRISGIEDIGYFSDYFMITNNTGFDIWYLYVITDEMFEAEDQGEDLLGDEILYNEYYAEIDPSLYDWLYDPIFVEWDMRLHILAEDLDGDKYHLEWYPDSDSWEIILTLDDLMDE
ncbi:MAG: trypsin-like peptidase domain-containing protein [Spirochaetales bacterium]|nr:trypsin-like peptidase domain-containing protein [Spirochaetales bacterium]